MPQSPHILEQCFKEQDEKVVKINGITFKSLKAIVDCCYTAKLDLDTESLPGILAAADLLQITKIINQCKKFMEENLSEETCLPFLRLAEKYQMENMIIEATKRFLDHFPIVRLSTDFKMMSKDALILLLSTDQLNTQRDEIEVFQAIEKIGFSTMWIEWFTERNL